VPESRASETGARTEAPRAGTGRSQVRPGQQLPWDASGSLRRTPMTNGPGSRTDYVPEKSPNNAGQPAARDGGKRAGQREPAPAKRVPDTEREDALSALERVVKQQVRIRSCGSRRFCTTLQPGNAAHGLLQFAEGSRARCRWETWRNYGETLEDNLQDLSYRLKRGAYRAKPVRRVYIPRRWRQRPLVPALEDKIVQRAAVEVLNAIYETDFSDSRMGPARAKPASSAGCALHGIADEKSELGARC